MKDRKHLRLVRKQPPPPPAPPAAPADPDEPKVFKRPSRRDPNFIRTEEEFSHLVFTAAEAAEDLTRNGNTLTPQEINFLVNNAREVVRRKHARRQ